MIIKDNVIYCIQNNIIQTEYAEYTENNKILISKGPQRLQHNNYILTGEDITVDTANKNFIERFNFKVGWK